MELSPHQEDSELGCIGIMGHESRKRGWHAPLEGASLSTARLAMEKTGFYAKSGLWVGALRPILHLSYCIRDDQYIMETLHYF